MEKKVLIVYGDKEQTERIASIVKSSAYNLGKRVTLFVANNTASAEKLLNRYDIDVMFLDIVYKDDMRYNYSGIDLIKYVRETDKYDRLPIIVVTNAAELKEYAYKKLLCYGFVEKNCREEVVYSLLRTALRYTTCGETEKQIVLRKKGVLYPIVIRDILYATIADHKLCFFFRDGEKIEIPNLTMKRFCEQHQLRSLVRCNRNVMVNRIHVQQINLEESYLMLKGCGKLIGIGPAFKKNIRRVFYIRKDGSVIV